MKTYYYTSDADECWHKSKATKLTAVKVEASKAYKDVRGGDLIVAEGELFGGPTTQLATKPYGHNWQSCHRDIGE